MKLTQRMLIGYYKTKFRTIGILSPQKAAETAFKLFCTPLQSGRERKTPSVFLKADPITFKYKQLNVRGFRWTSNVPHAKRVLLAHGFSSYAYKFEKYVVAYRKLGYEVLAFDAPAHGNSDGNTINALVYRDCILLIEKHFGKLDIIIGHSLGGFAASLAVEKMQDSATRKLILIAPATETKTALTQFNSLMSLSEAVQEALVTFIEKLANEPLTYFSTVRAVRFTNCPTLWIHDTDDKICPYKDTDPIRIHPPNHLLFKTTSGLGHNKIYRDTSVIQSILAFSAN